MTLRHRAGLETVACETTLNMGALLILLTPT